MRIMPVFKTLLLCSLLVVLSCGTCFADDEKAAVTVAAYKYYAAIMAADLPAVQQYTTAEFYVAKIGKEPKPKRYWEIVKAVGDKTSYTMAAVQMSGETAIVKLAVTAPARASLRELWYKVGTEDEQEQIAAYIELIKAGAAELEQAEVVLTLVKENGLWKVNQHEHAATAK